MSEEKISNYQFFLLVFLYTIGSSILILPNSMAAFGKQDGWTAVILGILIGALLILFYVKIAGYIKEATFVEFLIKVFGEWVGKFIALLFSIYLFIFGRSYSALLCGILCSNGDFITNANCHCSYFICITDHR